MSNSLDPDQARRLVGPVLGPNCLPRLSADNTGRQRVKVHGKQPRSCQDGQLSKHTFPEQAPQQLTSTQCLSFHQ